MVQAATVSKDLRTREQARVVSMWLIHAPEKCYNDAVTSNEHTIWKAEPHFWGLWRQFLMDAQAVYMDVETQAFIKDALEQMDEVKARKSIAGQSNSLVQ